MTQKQMFSFRLPEEAISEMEEIANHLYIPMRTMARQWIMQRLNAIRIEKEKENNLATGADAPTTTPVASPQRTHEVVAHDTIS